MLVLGDFLLLLPLREKKPRAGRGGKMLVLAVLICLAGCVGMNVGAIATEKKWQLPKRWNLFSVALAVIGGIAMSLIYVP